MILTLFFFIFGLLTPFLLLFAVVLCISYYKGSILQKERRKLKSPQKRFFVYGTQSTIQWLNKILSKAYPHIVTSKFLTFIINSQIPKILEKTPIESIDIENLDMSKRPPIIKHAKLLTGLDVDYIEVSFVFTPKLVINSNSVIKYIRTFSLGLTASIDSIDGGIALKLPERTGPATMLIEKSTSIKLNVGATVGNVVTISTDVLGKIWEALSEAINSVIRNVVATIPIEELLYIKIEKKEKKGGLFKCKFNVKTSKIFSTYVI